MKNIISSRSVFAVHHGERKGQLFVFINKDKERLGFLAVPEVEAVWVSVKDFDEGIDNEILKFVEVMPEEEHKMCVAEFNGRLTGNNS